MYVVSQITYYGMVDMHSFISSNNSFGLYTRLHFTSKFIPLIRAKRLACCHASKMQQCSKLPSVLNSRNIVVQQLP